MKTTDSYELVAPDGGFGFVILIAAVINLTITGTQLNSYGIIYRDYFIELNMSSTNITVLAGISATFSALGAFIVAPLLKFTSERKAVLLGSFLYNIGILCTVFSESQIIFYVFQGIIQNIGFGMMYNVTYTIINKYFVKKRFLVLNLTQTIVAVIILIEPHIFKWWTEMYGHRGTLIFVCSLTVQSFVAGALMQPVSWHMKKVKINHETEMKLLEDDCEFSPNTSHAVKLSVDRDMSKNESFVARLKNLIDIDVVQSFTLSMECLGTSICIIIDLTYLYMLPQALKSYKWSENDMAWVFTAIALGDLLMKVVLILFSKWFDKIRSCKVYITGIMLAVVSRIGFAVVENMVAVTILFTIMGASQCILFVILVLVISEAVSPEKFTAAIGIFLMCGSFVNITVAPIIGAIRDYTGSYAIALNIITAIYFVIGVTWVVKLVINKECISKTRDRKISMPNENMSV